MPRLAVLAWGYTSAGGDRCRWPVDTNAPSKLHVFVDATTGAVADSYDEVGGTGIATTTVGSVTIGTSGFRFVVLDDGPHPQRDPLRWPERHHLHRYG